VERYTVSQITAAIGEALEAEFSDTTVEGEVSGFKAHGSGHWYFSLKDGQAVLNCAMFRNDNAKVRRAPRDGDKLACRGGIDVYAPRGSYSLIVRKLEATGEGDLLRKLAELRERLRAEGLFDSKRKRPLPTYPRAIGVATSPTGAAFADILRVVRGRFPGLTIYLAPCRVQGEGAAAEIVAALRLLQAHGRSDVIIVGRGGGSAEDLWCFNEEAVVRAVAASAIPTVSAVGHEVDTALTDFAADVRAATPSHAAELVTPEGAALEAWLFEHQARLRAAAAQRVRRGRERLAAVRLQHPRQRVERGRMRCDELAERLAAAVERYASRRRDRLTAAARHLDALSPLKVLDRGYAIALRDGVPVRDAHALSTGDRLDLRLAVGARVVVVAD
jgi:exodeoxyribonuclease VII large subunit